MSISARITSNNGSATTQACAACKYQRRKCAPDCILSPYFPHYRQRQFLNAHKLFGVKNITNIIKNLEPQEKDEAMKTIIFQSDVRANDPVGGCYRIIRELQRQIEFSKAELDLVLHQLAICRAQTHLQPNQIHQDTDDSVVLTYNDIVNGASDDLSSFDSIQNYDPYVQPPQPDPLQEQQDHHHQFVIHLSDDHQDNNAWNMQQNQEDPTMLSGSDSLQVKQQPQEHIGEQQQQQQDVKPQLVDIPYERHEIKFENDQVERRRFVPSTQLLISS